MAASTSPMTAGSDNAAEARPLRRVGFSLGSNMGNRLAMLERACDRLAEQFGSLRLSQVYETDPVDCPEGSPAYLNACVEVETDMPAEEILALCLRTETELGRVRGTVYGTPRTCDIDLLYCGDEVLRTETLTLPHPLMTERAFVLQPLCDIDPLLVLPGQSRTVAELLEALPPEHAVVLYPL